MQRSPVAPTRWSNSTHSQEDTGLASGPLWTSCHQSQVPYRMVPPFPRPDPPPDFFLWGHLKDKVYSSKPKTISELKANIVAETRRIGQDTIEAVIKNFTGHVAVCAQRGGRHIEHRISLFFKSSFLTVIIVVLS